MFFRRVLLTAIVASTLIPGCTPASQHRDLEFKLQKAEQERDALARQLSSAQARAIALQGRLDTESEALAAYRAKANALADQVRKLDASLEQLRELLERQAARPIERPTIALSPLPETVDAALNAWSSKYGDRVAYDPARGAVSFANDRLFDTGSADVRTDAHAALHDLAAVLAAAASRDFDVVVVGHTDAAPITRPETLAAHPTNWHLSVHRAIAVQDVLLKAGLSASHTAVMGCADKRPVGSDAARNRRVEVFIVPRGAVASFAPVRTR